MGVPLKIPAGRISGFHMEEYSSSHKVTSVSSSEISTWLSFKVNFGEDWDGDGWRNSVELSCGTERRNFSSIPSDIDGNGVCDESDWDDDGDGVADEQDDFPTDPSEWIDNDGDGIGSNAESSK